MYNNVCWFVCIYERAKLSNRLSDHLEIVHLYVTLRGERVCHLYVTCRGESLSRYSHFYNYHRRPAKPEKTVREFPARKTLKVGRL